jgi:hypothetical protein
LPSTPIIEARRNASTCQADATNHEEAQEAELFFARARKLA